MSGIAVLLLLFMLARAQGGGSDLPTIRKPLDLPYNPNPVPSPGVAPAPTSPLAHKAANTPPPWPQATPAGLPPFGAAGWEFDSPPPADVQVRATQLLPQLWKYGAGTKKTEQTSGRWITYRAEKMGTKKGVVAYRIRAGHLLQPSPEGGIPSV